MDTIAKQTVQSAFYMLATLCAETSHVKVSTFAAAEGQHTSGPSTEVKPCGPSTPA